MFTSSVLYFTVYLCSCCVIISLLVPWFLLEEYLHIVGSETHAGIVAQWAILHLYLDRL
jgi:hypothetical protein